MSGTNVSGTGTWSGEACCGGTLTLAGYVQGDSIYVGLEETGSPFIRADSTIALVAVVRSSTEMVVSSQKTPGSGEFRMRKCTGGACDGVVVH